MEHGRYTLVMGSQLQEAREARRSGPRSVARIALTVEEARQGAMIVGALVGVLVGRWLVEWLDFGTHSVVLVCGLAGALVGLGVQVGACVARTRAASRLAAADFHAAARAGVEGRWPDLFAPLTGAERGSVTTAATRDGVGQDDFGLRSAVAAAAAECVRARTIHE